MDCLTFRLIDFLKFFCLLSKTKNLVQYKQINIADISQIIKNQ